MIHMIYQDLLLFSQYTNADRLKLWKVGIPIKQQSPELTAVSNFSVNIKEELGGVELSPFDDISEHFDDDSKKPVKKNLHIIVQPLIEDSKEVHCTASYGNRNNKITFQWTVTREMVTLAGLKKRLCEYFTFPDWTESEHLVISRVVGKRFGTKSKSSSSKTIHISTDEDLASIIWTPAPKMDLKIVVDTPQQAQQQFSSYTYSKMRTLFGLQVNDYYNLPTEASPHITCDINEPSRRVFISSIIYAVASSFDGDVKIFSEYEVSGRYGKGLIDWIIRIGDIIIHVTEAKGNVISHGIGQSTVQAHASMQRNKLNRKKRSYDDADLYDEEMFCIISTGIEWIMTKVILKSNSNGGNVEVRVCLPIPDPIPINKVSLSRGDIREPVSKLLLQIKGLLEEQKNSLMLSIKGTMRNGCPLNATMSQIFTW
ncbi:unnamed protein product [Rhizophagus irregularis]|uniref:Uncharacterized protein n=1 Tax=Rhizophagus irregularis TaxID=588596 RepID=A0A915Z940_9GLOM|nr:unnamed protein product [Rhizophagus irregularis]